MLQPPSLIDRYRRADDLLASGQLQQAADICKDMLETNPDFAHGYHLMASLFRTTGNMEKALIFSQLSIKLAPMEADFYAQQGHILLALSHFEAAASSFENAHRINPKNILYVIFSAEAYARLGKHEHAAELFSCARSMAAPEEANEIDEREGLHLLALGKIDEAEKLFEKIIYADPLRHSGYLNKAKILLYRGRDHEAEICFAKAINCNPHSHEALHGMAVINERQGQIDAAIAMAIQAVNTNGALFDSLLLLGGLLMRRQNWQGAEQIFRQALSIVPDNIYAMQGFANALAAQKRIADARQYLSSSILRRKDDKAVEFFSAALRGDISQGSAQEYAAAFFNEYAGRYDIFMQQNNICKTSSLHEQLLALPQLAGKNSIRLLDLGCGTGALSQDLVAAASLRVGVDISARMIDIARTKQYYSELYTLEACEFALASDRSFDLIMAIEILPYFAKLENFFSCARNLLSPSSVMAFSIEKCDDKNEIKLMPSGRHAHSTDYVRAVLSMHGYEIISNDEILLRFDFSSPVKGENFIVRKMTLH